MFPNTFSGNGNIVNRSKIRSEHLNTNKVTSFITSDQFLEMISKYCDFLDKFSKSNDLFNNPSKDTKDEIKMYLDELWKEYKINLS